MIGCGNALASLAHSVLYLRHAPPEASPKAISGRTSYLQVRLAFHPYPQVIRAVFNRHRCGPPPRDYRGFTLPMGSSPGFGSTAGNWVALADSLSLRLRLCALTSLPTVTRRFILQKARRHPTPPIRRSIGPGLRPLVSTRFQVLFHSPPGVLFTFPSRY